MSAIAPCINTFMYSPVFISNYIVDRKPLGRWVNREPPLLGPALPHNAARRLFRTLWSALVPVSAAVVRAD